MKKKEKVSYEIEPSGKISFMRTVVDGEFSIDKNNILTYRLKRPIPASAPQQFKLSGNWALNEDHNLVFKLNKDNYSTSADKLTLETEIIDAKANELVLSITTKDSRSQAHFYTLKLGGKWQADKYNRLSFLITKDKGQYDTLTFSSSWEVNKQNQLLYTYLKSGLKRKEKLSRTITFKGYWDITEKNRVSYVLNKEIDSGFDFKVSLGKPAKRGLEYEIGIGAAPIKKKFILSGSWKINEKLGLLFEMPYEEGKIRSIVFGTTCRLGKGTNLEFRLRNNLHKDLGIDLRLSKTIFKGSGEAFLKALKDEKEISCFAGAGMRW